MFGRTHIACLALVVALLPGTTQAAEPKIGRLRVSRDVFSLDAVTLSCDIAPRLEAGQDGTPLEARYRFRVLDEGSHCRWDSGWNRAFVARRGVLHTSPVAVSCRLDSASAAELTEVRIEVMAEVSTIACPPVQWRFYRWADGRFRSRPEPATWPDHRAEAAAAWSDLPVKSAAIVISASSTTSMILSQPVTALPALSGPRVSWGHLKASYR
jgi:hypothetical protein